MKNYYSSFVFAVLPFFIEDRIMRTLMSIFAGTSILHHAKKHETYPGKQTVAVLDKVLVHTIAAVYTLKALEKTCGQGQWSWLVGVYWLCLGYIISVYYVWRLSFGRHGEAWHASVHLASAVGVLAITSQ